MFKTYLSVIKIDPTKAKEKDEPQTISLIIAECSRSMVRGAVTYPILQSSWKWELSPHPTKSWSLLSSNSAMAKQWFYPQLRLISWSPVYFLKISIFLGLLNSYSPIFLWFRSTTLFKYFFFCMILRTLSIPNWRQSL